MYIDRTEMPSKYKFIDLFLYLFDIHEIMFFCWVLPARLGILIAYPWLFDKPLPWYSYKSYFYKKNLSRYYGWNAGELLFYRILFPVPSNAGVTRSMRETWYLWHCDTTFIKAICTITLQCRINVPSYSPAYLSSEIFLTFCGIILYLWPM